MDLASKVLSPRDLELYALCEACDIDMDPQIFRILLDLLRLDVCPIALFRVLQSIVHSPVKGRATKKPPVAAKPKSLLKDFNYTQAMKQKSQFQGDATEQRQVH